MGRRGGGQEREAGREGKTSRRGRRAGGEAGRRRRPAPWDAVCMHSAESPDQGSSDSVSPWTGRCSRPHADGLWRWRGHPSSTSAAAWGPRGGCSPQAAGTSQPCSVCSSPLIPPTMHLSSPTQGSCLPCPPRIEAPPPYPLSPPHQITAMAPPKPSPSPAGEGAHGGTDSPGTKVASLSQEGACVLPSPSLNDLECSPYAKCQQNSRGRTHTHTQNNIPVVSFSTPHLLLSLTLQLILAFLGFPAPILGT